MFDFGKPEDTATLFRESALRMKGPALPDCSLNEMEEQDLRNMLTYLYSAVRNALEEGVEEKALEILVAEYDEVFVALAEASDRFRSMVKNGKHQVVLGVTRENVDKYRKLAGV
jgi:hypothetical protein